MRYAFAFFTILFNNILFYDCHECDIVFLCFLLCFTIKKKQTHLTRTARRLWFGLLLNAFNLRFILQRQKKNGKLLILPAIYATNSMIFALLLYFARRKNAVFYLGVTYMPVCLRRNTRLFLKKLRKARFTCKPAFLTDIRKTVIAFP